MRAAWCGCLRNLQLQSQSDRAESRAWHPFETPTPERVQSFQEIVRRSVPCFIRKPRGLDILRRLRPAQTKHSASDELSASVNVNGSATAVS